MNIIKKLRKEKGISQQQLAELCCVHQTAVSQWENGRTVPDTNSLKLLANALGVSVETLLGIDKPNDNRIQGFMHLTAATARKLLGESELFALTASDNGMSPTIQLGDTVIVKRCPEPENGSLVAVAIGNNAVTVKKLIKKDTSILLVSENPAYEPMLFTFEEIRTTPIVIIGKVIEMRRTF